MSGTSFGECSVSSRSQSKPECETISAATGLHRLHHSPICNCPLAIACLNALRGMSMVNQSSAVIVREGGRSSLHLTDCYDCMGREYWMPRLRGHDTPCSHKLHRNAAERTEVTVHG